MRKIIIFLVLLAVFTGINQCFAYDQVNKNLNLVKGYVYLLDFNDKIVRYSLGNNDAAKIELISSIFQNQQEIIIKTLKEADTNLLIWTKDNVYNFNINIAQNKSKNTSVVTDVKDNAIIAGSPVIQNFSKDDKNLPDDVKTQLEGLSIDPPPHLSKNQDLFGFEIDPPPGR